MNKLTSSVAAFACLLGLAGPAAASSHREAPSISQDPVADNTDLWAWTSKAHDKLYVVAAYNPLEEPAGGPNFHQFSDDVLYEIHVTGAGDTAADHVVYQIDFSTRPIARVGVDDMKAGPGGGKEFFAQLTGLFAQTYTVTRVEYGKNGNATSSVVAKDVPVAPPNIGPRTMMTLKAFGQLSTDKYDDAFAATFTKATSEGGRVWAGPRDDGFYVDLSGVFDLANLRNKGQAQDNVAGYNCHAIAIEIPANGLTADGASPGNTAGNRSTVGVWASASRRQVSVLHRSGQTTSIGPWVQVSRLGLPLINEAVIGIQDKDRYNRARPPSDVTLFGAYFLNPIVVRDAEAVGIYKAINQDPTPFKYGRTDIVDVINLKDIPMASSHSIALGNTGDLLRVDLATNSAFPNGRPLGDVYNGATTNRENDVTDILLSVLLAKGMVAIKDNVDYNDRNYLNDMPWLPLPHEGYSDGHGKVTP